MGESGLSGRTGQSRNGGSKQDVGVDVTYASIDGHTSDAAVASASDLLLSLSLCLLLVWEGAEARVVGLVLVLAASAAASIRSSSRNCVGVGEAVAGDGEEDDDDDDDGAADAKRKNGDDGEKERRRGRSWSSRRIRSQERMVEVDGRVMPCCRLLVGDTDAHITMRMTERMNRSSVEVSVSGPRRAVPVVDCVGLDWCDTLI